MDADCCATHASFHGLIKSLKYGKIIQTEEEATYCLIFVIVLIFTIILKKSSIEKMTGTHPSAALRIHCITLKVFECVNSDEWFSKSSTAFVDFWKIADKIFTYCDVSEFESLYGSNEQDKMYAALLDNWQLLKTRLQKFSLTNLDE